MIRGLVDEGAGGTTFKQLAPSQIRVSRSFLRRHIFRASEQLCDSHTELLAQRRVASRSRHSPKKGIAEQRVMYIE
jgi:hypothetical protein